MSWIENFFGVNPEDTNASRKVAKGAYDDVERCLEETRIPYIRTDYRDGSLTPVCSRLGGVPWAPDGFEWPMDSKGVPLTFVLQINFSEIPTLDPFPISGLLQLYIGTDDFYGADFDKNDESGFHVVFYSDPVSGVFADKPVTRGELYSPLHQKAEHGLGLSFEEATMVMPPSDWRFGERVLKDSPAVGDDEWIEAFYDRIDEQNNLTTIYFGGFSGFTQTDPREFEVHLRDHDFALVTVDSDDAIMWGDSGIGQFMARSADIVAKDFSNVAYNWDCC